MYKIAKTINSLIDSALLLGFLLMTVIGIYMIADYTYVYTNDLVPKILPTQSSVEEVEQSLSELSSDAVAWLVIDDTNINFPIMHCDNNSKYVNTDAYGNYSIAGAIFMDARNHDDFLDLYSIIYGHHFARGYMFGALDQFENEEYFDTHRTGTLYYGGEAHQLNIFGFAILDALDETFFDPTTTTNAMHDYIRDRVLIYRNNYGGRILALTTCRDPGSTSRTLVFCEVL